MTKKTHSGLSPILKWPGGKEKELKVILQNVPESFDRFFEPFVGGGSVFTAISAPEYFINDKSEELIGLYRAIASPNKDFFRWTESISNSWKEMLHFSDTHRDLCALYRQFRDGRLTEEGLKAAVGEFLYTSREDLTLVLADEFIWRRETYRNELLKNLTRKILRMEKLEREKGIMSDEDVYRNIKTAQMSALYMYYRRLYNDEELKRAIPELGTALFFFIRNYAYSGMFRYSSKGDFNVPYGGMGYNNKLLTKKMHYYKSQPLQDHLAKTHISCLDFEDFLLDFQPREDDFIFLDPPYDTEFSTYATNEFTPEDHKRLADCLINHTHAKWMMVIKNTPLINTLYNKNHLNIRSFDKTYQVSFMNRNDKSAEHLIITNY